MSSKEFGKCVIVSAPSGAGKTTIVHHLMKEIPQLGFSVSATNRSPRTHEVDGVDYVFLDTEEFKRRIKAEDFVEWEEVYEGQYYGTLKSEVDRILRSGEHVIFDVDVLGGLNLKKYFKEESISIFIEPPTLAVLEDRLRKRGTETEEDLLKRIAKAEDEIAINAGFDVIVINDNLKLACDMVVGTVRGFLKR